MFLDEYGLPEVNEELCVEDIKNKNDYINNLKNGLLAEDPELDDQKNNNYLDNNEEDKPNIFHSNINTARYSQGSNETANVDKTRKSNNTAIQTMSPINRVRPIRNNKVGVNSMTEQGPMSIVI